MNWKPAVAAAVIVSLAGLAVGVLIGGKETVRTKTVERTVTPPGAPDAQDPPPSDETTGPTAVVEPTYVVEELGEDGELVSDNNSYEPGVPATVGGEDFRNAIAVNELFTFDTTSDATLELPVKGKFRTFNADLGWSAETPSKADVTLEIYKDQAGTGSEPVYKQRFTKGQPKAVNVSVAGTTTLVFLWTLRGTDKKDYEPANEGSFVIANARFTP